MASEQLTIDSPYVLDEKSLESQFPKLFYVTKTEDAYGIIQEYELKTVSKYVTYRETKGFGNCLPLSDHIEKANMKKGHKILWTDGTEVTEKIPYDGVPYILLGSKIMDCMYGPNRFKSLKKQKNKTESENEDMNTKRKTRGESRKRDCPAQIFLREVHKFPEFKIPSNSMYNRRVTSKSLRKALQSASEDLGERRIYIALPRLMTHRGHTVGRESELKFSLDPRVRDKIYELVYEGEFNSQVLQTRAYEYVRNELFKGRNPPPVTNRRYFPILRVIKSYCYQARIRMRNQGIDVPLPKEPERTKKPGPQRRTQDGPCSKEGGDEGNVAAHSLLLLDQPIREEEVDTEKESLDKPAETEDDISGIDNILLEKDETSFPLAEKTDCLTLINHLKELTEASSDRAILTEVKGHLLEAITKFHRPLMEAGAIENPAKKRRLQVDSIDNASADQLIPIRLQKDPSSNKHVVIIDHDNWSMLGRPVPLWSNHELSGC